MDYADKIAGIVWFDADAFPETPTELKVLLARAARKGYELGYGAADSANTLASLGMSR